MSLSRIAYLHVIKSTQNSQQYKYLQTPVMGNLMLKVSRVNNFCLITISSNVSQDLVKEACNIFNHKTQKYTMLYKTYTIYLKNALFVP